MTTDPGREVTLQAGDRALTLYAGNRALRLIERETGEPLLTLFDRFNSGDITLVTTLVWALLQRHHPETTIDDTDDVIDAAGYEAVSAAIERAVERAFPRSANGEARGKDGPGTGTM